MVHHSTVGFPRCNDAVDPAVPFSLTADPAAVALIFSLSPIRPSRERPATDPRSRLTGTVATRCAPQRLPCRERGFNDDRLHGRFLNLQARRPINNWANNSLAPCD